MVDCGVCQGGDDEMSGVVDINNASALGRHDCLYTSVVWISTCMKAAGWARHSQGTARNDRAEAAETDPLSRHRTMLPHGSGLSSRTVMEPSW